MVYQYAAAAVIGLGAVGWKLIKGESEETEEEKEEGPGNQPENKESESPTSSDVSEPERYSAGVNESYIAHKQAGQRDAPVELGEVYELLLEEETEHHRGKRNMRGKYEGFNIFVKDVSDSVEVDDIVTVKITSFNRGGTSADAKMIGS